MSPIFIQAEMDGPQIHQSKSASSNNFVHEYCPAPFFSLGLDDILNPETTIEGAQGGDGPNSIAKHEYIQILDDRDDLEFLAGIEACELFTPEKTSNKGEEGSASKFYSSSSSGEPVPNKFERRIIKPSPCIRSPFTDYNEKKLFHCKPDVNWLYSSVILHGRLNEEVSSDVDTRYNVV